MNKPLAGNDCPIPSSCVAVGQIMTPHPVSLAASATLAQAAEQMETRSISCLLVEDGDLVIGILTERDVVRALCQGIAPDQAVAALMSRKVKSVKTSDDTHAAYQVMALHGIRHLLVVDDADRPQGIVTETDFRKRLGLETFVGALPVSSAMSSKCLELPGNSPVATAAAEMHRHSASCMVITDNGLPRGIVTERDIVKLFRAQSLAAPLSEVMTSPLVSVAPDALLVDAVSIMQQHNIRRLAVVNDDGSLAGMLSEHDIIRQTEGDYVRMLQQLVIKQAQQLNDDKFRAVLDQLPHKIMIKDTTSTYVCCNASYAQDLGIRPEEIAGKSDFDFFPPELAERYRADDRRVISEAIELSTEEPYIQDGREYWIHTSKTPMRDSHGNIIGVVVLFQDITEKKKSAHELMRQTWALQALSDSNKALVYAASEGELLQAVCDAIVRQNRYPLAWFGCAETDAQCSVNIVASSGIAQGYLQDFRVSWGDDPWGQGPTGQCIRSGQAVVNNNASANTHFAPWLARAQTFGIAASLSLPIKLQDKVAGTLTIYARDPQAFNDREYQLLQELADNLAFGLQARRTRTAYEEAVFAQGLQAKQLEKALEKALAAVAATLEQRDPYTAGHERQVAELAVKIGRELGLSEERLQYLYLAGTVHDIGKIQVPAELLAKPGRLTPTEFALVKLHPQVGYDILKPIDFPWPLAETIRQHHEYLDGSGYPRGLKDDDILLEARILTVADIVDSMSSDRPYRPALSLQDAKREITKMRGSKLDSAVVDACLAVLERGDYEPCLMHAP